MLTGRCNLTTATCEVRAWCPVEGDTLPLGPGRAVLAAAENFTLLVKNQIYFPKFGRARTNILVSQNTSYLSHCRHGEADPWCPVFTIGDIVAATGQTFADIAVLGGVVNIDISWQCDLDRDFLSHCRPVYTFSRCANISQSRRRHSPALVESCYEHFKIQDTIKIL